MTGEGTMSGASGWHGVFAYLPTLLGEDERLDAASHTKLVEHLVASGVHGLTPLGSTGEFPYVAAAEKTRLAEVTVAAADGRVPVVHGVGGFAVRDVLEQVRAADAAGVAGLLCIQQAFYHPSDDEVVAFHEAVADATDLPVVVYHNPGQCRVEFSDEVVARLARVPQIVGFKDASGVFRNVRRWQRVTDHAVDLFAATAVPLVPAMLHGAVGWMSGPACAVPRESVLLYDLCRAGEWERAVAVEDALAPLGAAFARFGQAQTVKALLAHQGFGDGRLTGPLRTIDGPEGRALAATWRQAVDAVDRLATVGG